tara:strand:+ start:1960 stop:2523 length:564 start_codon:yes stop_codon:yes gene_type:complete
MATLYINASRIKKDTALGSAVDDNLLHPYILIAQDRWILPALGTDLDDKLKQDIVDSTLVGNYDKLVTEFIQPCLVQLAFAEVAYVMRLRFSNNSVTLIDNEQGTSASMGDIKMVVQKATDIGMFYRGRLVDYLCHNTSLFPEYSSNSGADLSPNTHNYFGNLNVDKNRIKSNREIRIAQGLGLKDY